MDWSQHVDLYCERTDPSFWAEPFNAVTNAAFIVAAVIALAQWRREPRSDWPVLLLIGVTAAIGTGSFIFHTFATRGAALFDTVPIGVFIYGYLLLALRRFWGLSLIAALGGVVAFTALSTAEAALVPAGALNGSHAYLPALAAVVVVAWPIRQTPSGRLMFVAAGTLAVSLTFRSVDLAVCDALPLGTHFLWHSLNGLALYLLLRAAMVAGRQADPAAPPPAP